MVQPVCGHWAPAEHSFVLQVFPLCRVLAGPVIDMCCYKNVNSTDARILLYTFVKKTTTGSRSTNLLEKDDSTDQLHQRSNAQREQQAASHIYNHMRQCPATTTPPPTAPNQSPNRWPPRQGKSLWQHHIESRGRRASGGWPRNVRSWLFSSPRVSVGRDTRVRSMSFVSSVNSTRERERQWD